MRKRCCALVLGGYVNGYSIIKELYNKGIRDIVLIDKMRNLASFSNKIQKFIKIDLSAEFLYQELNQLRERYEGIIIYPTDDRHLELLNELYERIQDFCFVPLNPSNILQTMDKVSQYAFCEKLQVGYPKTLPIVHPADLEKVAELCFPVLLKPSKKLPNLGAEPCDNEEQFRRKQPLILGYLEQNVSFLASEIIPGDGSNIYAYVGYRNKEGQILNEWAGRKLSQFPNDFGMFSSATNQAPEEILHLGRTLIHGMNLQGICEPEFKYDHRDGKFKLMEINLRSMMWHRVGNLSGVDIQYTQFLDALGEQVERQIQNQREDIHLVYFKHEIINLFTRKGYLRTFYQNLCKYDQLHFAVFDKRDWLPFLFDCLCTGKDLIISLLKRTRAV